MENVRRMFPVTLAALLVAFSVSGCAGSAGSNSESSSTGSTSESGSTGSSSGNSSGSNSDSSSDDSTDTEVAEAVWLDSSDLFSNRDKEVGYDESTSVTVTLADGESVSSLDSAVTIEGDTITITQEGTYILNGTLTNGQVQVNVKDSDKVQLVLDNVSITNESSAAIYIVQADKVFITLAEGSSNTLSQTGEFEAIDDNNIDGAIFSKDDLTLNGNGTLTISCVGGHGIVSKDDLVITSGTYVITAEGGNGLSGKDCVLIADGDFTITASNDAIHSENSDDATLGYIYIAGGAFDLTASASDGSEGIDASYIIQIEGGTFTVASSAGKGVKADSGIYLTGADITVNSYDDAIHTNGVIEIESGSYTLASSDDGIHADEELTINGGTIDITKSYEGLEALTITINDGEITLVSSDDGINAAGGSDSSGFMSGMGGGRDWGGSTSSSGTLVINGGTIEVDASGDGIDSNGTLEINGGVVYVSGPTSSADCAVDWESSGVINGGILIAAGASGMQESPDSSSSQCSMLISASGSANDTITITDSDGNVLASYTPSKQYSCVVISCPEIESDGTYTVTCGDSETSVTMSGTVYSDGGGMGGMNGGMGGGMNNGGMGGGRR
ncbi:MAG: carbohydrate-binding domain-containing protein [Clostridiales bacterium]|nr:carbohydrate-binding domain-containing protein [Clostridiales bacterium]